MNLRQLIEQLRIFDNLSPGDKRVEVATEYGYREIIQVITKDDGIVYITLEDVTLKNE